MGVVVEDERDLDSSCCLADRLPRSEGMPDIPVNYHIGIL